MAKLELVAGLRNSIKTRNFYKKLILGLYECDVNTLKRYNLPFYPKI